MQYSYPPLLTAGSKERSAKARSEAEALFRPAPPVPEVSTAVVILKKRRSVPSVEHVDSLAQQTEDVRAPRVHRVGPKSGEVAAAAAELEPPVANPAPEAIAEPKPVRRRRRLHGPVSILRPASAEVPDEEMPDDSITLPSSAPIVEKPASSAFEADDFFAKGAAWKQYTALRAQIGQLQAEADQLRKLEVAKAIEWIRAGIRDYGLTAQDLGFR